MSSQLRRRTRPSALNDIIDGAKLYKTWAYLSYQDLISRYRRSILGPFWIAALMITQSIALSLVFGTIYNIPVKEFLPYIIGGLIVINLVGCAFSEGSETFNIYKSLLSAHPLPISFHVLRMFCRQFVIFLHNFVVFIAVQAYCTGGIHITPLVIPALLIASIFIISTTFLTACLSVRFIDFKFGLPHLWTIVFYFTPVIWRPTQISEKLELLFKLNPIYYILEVVRSQMLGETIGLDVWGGAIVVIIATSILGYIAFAITRKRISLWA